MKPIALRGTGGRPSSTGGSAEQSLPGPGSQDVTWPSPPSGTQTPRAHRLSSICFSVRTPCSPVATSVCTSQRCVATPLYTHPVVLSLCPCTDIPHLCSAGEPRLPSAWNLAKQLNPQVVYNSSRLWVTVPSFTSRRLQVHSVWRVTGSQDWKPDTAEGTAITLQREAGPHHALEAPHSICQPSSWSRAMGATFQELAEPLMRHLHSTKRDVKVLAMTSS